MQPEKNEQKFENSSSGTELSFSHNFSWIRLSLSSVLLDVRLSHDANSLMYNSVFSSMQDALLLKLRLNC